MQTTKTLEIELTKAQASKTGKAIFDKALDGLDLVIDGLSILKQTKVSIKIVKPRVI